MLEKFFRELLFYKIYTRLQLNYYSMVNILIRIVIQDGLKNKLQASPLTIGIYHGVSKSFPTVAPAKYMSMIVA